MKRFILILVLALTANTIFAQHRIRPMMDINQSTYEEAIDILNMMERTSYIEKMEGIKLDANIITTYGGEILLQKDGNSIKIIHQEFTILLNEHISYIERRQYAINRIRTELFIQNAKLFEYMCEKLHGNRDIKNMYIKVDHMTGGSYIIVEYYNL